MARWRASAATVLLVSTAACSGLDPQVGNPQPGSSAEAVPASTAQAGQASRFQLRVSLYPWVPDAAALIQWVENDFEAKHPSIDLVVRALEKSDESSPAFAGDLAYEPDRTVAALTAGDPDFQHIVEVDAVILGELATRGVVAPFDVRGAAFLPGAAEAVTWNGTRYGVPHWTCGYFIISENPAIRTARTAERLAQTLSAASTPRVDLAGDLDGSWDAITVALDSYHDSDPAGDPQSVLSGPQLPATVGASLRMLQPACTRDGKNYCGEDAVDLFAAGEADALAGYSERLNLILSRSGSRAGALHVASAPFGNGDHPSLFTDALVLSRACSSQECRSAAQAFADYYVSDAVFETVLMSRDVGQTAVPRYLLPSTTTAFFHGQVRNDPLYRQLWEEIQGAKPFPNEGIPQARARGTIRTQVRQALGLLP